MQSGRIALVLGAAGGIGGETALALSRHGWKIRAPSQGPQMPSTRKVGILRPGIEPTSCYHFRGEWDAEYVQRRVHDAAIAAPSLRQPDPAAWAFNVQLGSLTYDPAELTRARLWSLREARFLRITKGP
jgi:NAD(P)-dependent dehydrogenase (short-subunit alcohol dehydrogenase family)